MFLEQQAVSGHFRDGLVGAAFPGDQRFCHANENKTKQRRVQHPGERGLPPLEKGQLQRAPWGGH